MKLLTKRERLFPCCKTSRFNVTFDDEPLLVGAAASGEYPVGRTCPQCKKKWTIGAMPANGASEITRLTVFKLQWRLRDQPVLDEEPAVV